MNRLGLIFPILVIWMAATAVQAEDITGRLVGVWIGEGVVRPNGFDAPEKIRCRMVGRAKTEQQVNLKGKCATTSGAARFKLMLAQDVTGKVFAAKGGFLRQKALLSLSGIRVGDVVTLNAKEPVQNGDRLLTTRLTLTVPLGKNFKMTNIVTDKATGERATSLALTLKRKR